MNGWKQRDLKNKSFVEIQELFHKALKNINTFVDFRTELVDESTKKDEAETTQESSSKREGDELKQERYKKQKVEDNKESKELMKCLEIILDDGHEVTIDATPLSSKSLTIVYYKIYKEGKKSYIQISEQMNILYYLFVEKMYPLTHHILHQMFNDVKLQVDYECEMAYELLRLVKKQLKERYVPQ
uniref:Uncharacterized protein n=1 Tax=Tanacetum cinerariifolium TaxID=118510 RepID=A0A6L2JJP5_TANCI|nr:hypothetical protein [Tanacetum cinerariifolium]